MRAKHWLGNTALAAAIVLALARSHWLAWQFRVLFLLSAHVSGVHVAIWVCDLLFVLPLPILLYLLFRTSTTVTITAPMRKLALGTALVHGLFFTVPDLYRVLLPALHDWRDLRSWGGETTAANIWSWLSHPNTWSWIESSMAPISQLALLFVLLALWQQKGRPQTDSSTWPKSLTRIAAAAIVMSLIGIALHLSRSCYAIFAYGERPHPGGWFPVQTFEQALWLNAKLQMRELCRVMIAVIVFASRPRFANDDVKDQATIS